MELAGPGPNYQSTFTFLDCSKLRLTHLRRISHVAMDQENGTTTQSKRIHPVLDLLMRSSACRKRGQIFPWKKQVLPVVSVDSSNNALQARYQV
jgi:hypothetical protein